MRYYSAFFAICIIVSCNSNGNYKSVALNQSKTVEGEIVFKKYCKSCHHAAADGGDYEFNFSNLFQRLPTTSPENYFIEFVKVSKRLKESGDQYSIELAKKWNSDYEHNFKDSLSAQDLKDLIKYIKDRT